jgi:hypothetical protein
VPTLQNRHHSLLRDSVVSVVLFNTSSTLMRGPEQSKKGDGKSNLGDTLKNLFRPTGTLFPHP